MSGFLIGPIGVLPTASGAVINNTTLDGTQGHPSGSGLTLANATPLVTTGAGVVCVAFHGNASASTATVSGSTLGAFTQVARIDDGGGTGSHILWLFEAVSAGALAGETITITYSASQGFASMLCWGIKGAISSSLAAAQDGSAATSGSSTSATYTSTNAADFVFTAVYNASDTGAPDTGAGWAAVGANSSGFLSVEYQLPTATGTFTGSITGDTKVVSLMHGIKST